MQRLAVRHEQVIQAPAASAWALLRDWAGLLKWWPSDAPFPILACEPLGDPTQLPFGRRVTLPGDAVGSEYLIHADEHARRIYYQLENGSLPGISNYVATTTVDDLGASGARMGFSSTFDMPDGADAAMGQGMILGVYRAIATGIERTARSAAESQQEG